MISDYGVPFLFVFPLHPHHQTLTPRPNLAYHSPSHISYPFHPTAYSTHARVTPLQHNGTVVGLSVGGLEV